MQEKRPDIVLGKLRRIAPAPRRQTPGITDILLNGALRPARQREILVELREAQIRRHRSLAMPPLCVRRIRETMLARRFARSEDGEDGVAAGGAFSEWMIFYS